MWERTKTWSGISPPAYTTFDPTFDLCDLCVKAAHQGRSHYRYLWVSCGEYFSDFWTCKKIHKTPYTTSAQKQPIEENLVRTSLFRHGLRVFDRILFRGPVGIWPEGQGPWKYSAKQQPLRMQSGEQDHASLQLSWNTLNLGSPEEPWGGNDMHVDMS